MSNRNLPMRCAVLRIVRTKVIPGPNPFYSLTFIPNKNRMNIRYCPCMMYGLYRISNKRKQA